MAENKRQNKIIRIQKKQHNFVMLDKGFLNDERLSFKAKGILAYVLSKPNQWKVVVSDLVKHSSDGKKAVYSGLNELKKFGYYKKVPVRDEQGRRISHWESIIYECPEETEETPPPNPKEIIDKKPVESTSALLSLFVQIENVDIQNRQRNNNYLSNNQVKSTSDRPDDDGTHDSTMWSDSSRTEKGLQKTAMPSKAIGSSEGQSKNKNANTSSFDEYTMYLRILQENIEYEHYIDTQPSDVPLIDELLNVILDVILSKGDTVRIGGEVKNRNMVKIQYLKINAMDVEHILDRYKEQRHRITHVNAYLRTMLYTVKQESDHFYTNRVRADGVMF